MCAGLKEKKIMPRTPRLNRLVSTLAISNLSIGAVAVYLRDWKYVFPREQRKKGALKLEHTHHTEATQSEVAAFYNQPTLTAEEQAWVLERVRKLRLPKRPKNVPARSQVGKANPDSHYYS
jgi:ATP adenylyltransferase/5',5'''-P-1,P-4-tetraphosphate phosphorylase II